MKERTMTVRQLMVLASELGAGHFYGLRDPFAEEELARIRAEYASILAGLESGGDVRLGFDGSVAVEEELAGLVRTCALCTRYVTVEQILCGTAAPARNLYLRGSRAVFLETDGDQVCLRETEPAQAASVALRGILDGCDAQDEDEDFYCVRQQTLQLCAQQSEQGLHALLESGMPQALAELLRDGVRQQAGYGCLSVVDLEKRTLQSVCAVFDARRLALLEPDEQQIDGWQARRLTPRALRARVEAMMQEEAE